MEKSRVNQAVQRRNVIGYNCVQAVVCTYCDLLGVDEKTAFKISEGFGLGIAGMMETCGALSGAIMLASLKNSDGNLKAPATKQETYKFSRSIVNAFKEKNNSCICRELKGLNGSDLFRSCTGCVIDAATLVEEMIFPGQFEKYDGPDE